MRQEGTQNELLQGALPAVISQQVLQEGVAGPKKSEY